MKDLIAKFRALPMKARVLVVALLTVTGLGGVGSVDYLFRVRPAAMNAGQPVFIPRAPLSPDEKVRFGATGDNTAGIVINGSGQLDVNSHKILHVSNGSSSDDAAAFGQIAAGITESAIRTATASFSADPSFNSHKITSLADGTAASDSAAFHQIADAILAGKANAVDAVSSTNLTLSGTQTVDGVALVAGNRELAYGQTTTTQDGCYVVASGAWTRCTDLPTGTGAADRCFVARSGTSNKGVWCATNASGSDVVGTADLTFTNVAAGGGGGGLTSPLSANLDFGANRATNAADPIAAQDLVTKAYLEGRGMLVAAATTVALPAYTTSGGPGVGFTLTASGNGVLPAIDGVTIVASATEARTSRVLLRNPATASDGGVYTFTSIGSVGTPWVAVRYTGCDTAAEIAGSSIVAMGGEQNSGASFTNDTPTALTIGTNAIAYRRTDSRLSTNQGFRLFDDCAGAGIAAVSGRVDSSLEYIISGTAAGITQTNPTTAGSWGAYQVATGSTTTGMAGFQAGPAFDIDSNTDLDVEFRFSTTTLSTVGQEYAINAGVYKEFAASQHAPLNGWAFVYDRVNKGTNLFAITTVGGVATGTYTDTGLVVNAGQMYRGHIRHPSGEANSYFWVDGSLVATHAANAPTNTLFAVYAAAFKSAGSTTTTALLLDSVRADVQRTTGKAP